MDGSQADLLVSEVTRDSREVVVTSLPIVRFDRPTLDTLFSCSADLVQRDAIQYADGLLRPFLGKATTRIHEYHDTVSSVLTAPLAKRCSGYSSLGFPGPRCMTHTPSSRSAGNHWPAHLNQWAVTGIRVPRALELNRCSTTRDSNAASAANRSPRREHPDLPERGQHSRRLALRAVNQTAPFNA